LSVKQPGREADHSLPSSAYVKNAWVCASIPHTSSWCGAYLSTSYVFMVWYLVKRMETFTFLPLSLPEFPNSVFEVVTFQEVKLPKKMAPIHARPSAWVQHVTNYCH